jgi:hypothetical protein
MRKTFITAESLLRDSFILAANILDSGLKPDFIVGIWRGGTAVGMAVQEYLAYHGVGTDHCAIRTSLYIGIDQQSDESRVYGLQYIVDTVNADDTLLIVDDVFDSGRSIQAVLTELHNRMRRNMPGTVKIACPWFKPLRNKTRIIPDYFVHETDDWLVFPHELCGLTPEEIKAGKSDLAPIWERLHFR